MKIFGAIVLFFAVLEPSYVSPAAHSLPKGFKQCKQNDPAVSKCLQLAVPDALRKMKSGIPSLGVFAIEPLVVNEIDINPGPNRPVSLKLNFRDLKMYGIPTSTVNDLDARFKEAKLLLTAFTKVLWFEADYVAEGKILVLPIKGAGRCNITMYDLETRADLQFKPQKKNGETYWNLQTLKIDFKPKKMTLYFDGSRSESKSLIVTLNSFINENWRTIFDELRPSFEQAFGAVFKEITQRVFSKVPINKMFPTA